MSATAPKTPAVPATPAAPTPDVPKICGTCEYWSPQAGLSKGICRLANQDNAAMELLGGEPAAMLLTAPTFYCSEWVAD